MTAVRALAEKRATDALLERAALLCEGRGQRFTPVRRRVLEAIAAAEQPLGAYDIMAEIGSRGERMAPPTVYRALDFLVAQGLVHRVHSQNAFVVCRAGDAPHSAALYLCRLCGRVLEVPCAALEGHVAEHANDVGFAVESLAVEVRGICAECAKAARREAGHVE